MVSVGDVLTLGAGNQGSKGWILAKTAKESVQLSSTLVCSKCIGVDKLAFEQYPPFHDRSSSWPCLA